MNFFIFIANSQQNLIDEKLLRISLEILSLLIKINRFISKIENFPINLSKSVAYYPSIY